MEEKKPPSHDLHSKGLFRDWHKSLTITPIAGVSNMCGAFVTNPVNVIKVRMQLNGALSSTTQEPLYKSFLSGILHIGRNEGLTGLWRGTGAALLREASYSSIRMGLYEPFKTVLGGNDPAHTPLWIKVSAGACAGIIGSAIANPTDVVMVRMQAHSIVSTRPTGAHPTWNYSGPFQAFASIARTEGINGLYRGLIPTMQRAALLNAAQAPSYDHAKHALLNAGIMQEGISCHLVASMVAGLMSAIVIAPVDLIRTRIMQQAIHPDGKGVSYTSTLDCFWKTLQSEGLQGLYKGFIPVWLRIGPHTIVTFFVFEQLRKSLGILPL